MARTAGRGPVVVRGDCALANRNRGISPHSRAARRMLFRSAWHLPLRSELSRSGAIRWTLSKTCTRSPVASLRMNVSGYRRSFDARRSRSPRISAREHGENGTRSKFTSGRLLSGPRASSMYSSRSHNVLRSAPRRTIRRSGHASTKSDACSAALLLQSSETK